MLPKQNRLTSTKDFQNVTKTNEALQDYSIQVNPRAINLFYIEDTIRERIVYEDNQYRVNNTNLSFSESETRIAPDSCS